MTLYDAVMVALSGLYAGALLLLWITSVAIFCYGPGLIVEATGDKRWYWLYVVSFAVFIAFVGWIAHFKLGLLVR